MFMKWTDTGKDPYKAKGSCSRKQVGWIHSTLHAHGVFFYLEYWFIMVLFSMSQLKLIHESMQRKTGFDAIWGKWQRSGFLPKADDETWWYISIQTVQGMPWTSLTGIWKLWESDKVKQCWLLINTWAFKHKSGSFYCSPCKSRLVI